MGKLKDLNDQTFNFLKVLKFVKIYKHLAYWLCLCTLCDKKIEIKSIDLTSGNKKSCGCLKKPNLIDKKYNKLTVMGLKIKRNHGERIWKCLCECGNITEVSTANLRNGSVKSCGCAARSNLTGNSYGLLKVLKYIYSRNGKPYWSCECQCGKIIYVSSSNLKSGQVKSCGCKTKEIRRNTNILKFGVDCIFKDKFISLKIAQLQNNSYTLKHWKTNEDLVCVASWEKKVVEYLNTNKINFRWQSKTFTMPDGHTYRPDMYLIGKRKWIEIKGYFRKDAKKKWNWFHKKYPNSELWDKKKLKEIGIISYG